MQKLEVVYICVYIYIYSYIIWLLTSFWLSLVILNCKYQIYLKSWTCPWAISIYKQFHIRISSYKPTTNPYIYITIYSRYEYIHVHTPFINLPYHWIYTYRLVYLYNCAPLLCTYSVFSTCSCASMLRQVIIYIYILSFSLILSLSFSYQYEYI